MFTRWQAFSKNASAGCGGEVVIELMHRFHWHPDTFRLTRFLLTALMLLVLLFTAATAHAQDEIDITITTDGRAEDGSELNIGDRTVLTLEIHHPAGSRTIIPSLPGNWGVFEVFSQAHPETETNPDGSLITRQTITITSFIPGTHTTPSFTVTLQDAVGSIIEKDAPGVTLTVHSVLQEGDTQLRDIKPQAKMNVPFPWFWLVGGLLLAGVISGALWWRRWRRPVPEEVIESVTDPRPPYQIALEELWRVETLKLPEQGKVKEHYTLVGDCLRHYLEGQFKLRALDRTTKELRRELVAVHQSAGNAPFAQESTHALLELFGESDLVKFARFKPSHEDAAAHLHAAVALVEQTKPKPPILEEAA